MSVLPPVPGVISQVASDAGDIDECAPAATIWCSVYADPSVHRATLTEFRIAAGVPDKPGPTGLVLDDVLRGARALWPHLTITRYKTPDWAGFARALKAGQAASLAVLSSELPLYLQFSFKGSHQIGVVYRGDKYLAANPLAKSGSAPLPISEATLRQAARAYGGGTIFAALFEPWEAKDMMFDFSGSDVIGVATVTRDTQLIRWDEARVPIAKGMTRNCYAVATLADGRKAYAVTFNGGGHFLVDDDRCSFVRAVDPHVAELAGLAKQIAELRAALSAALAKIKAALAALS